MKTTLSINNIECHAYHGCLPEETRIGSKFSVDIIIDMDLSKAVESDDLNQTADYVFIHNLVRKEMAIPSKLIEHVAGRILDGLSSTYTSAKNITVRVHKYNPPVNGFIGDALFEVTLK